MRYPHPGGPDERRRRFEEVYAANCDPILGYALRRTDNPDDAADVIAETFLTAWRRLDAVPPGDQARLWLYGVARRVLANQRRGERRRTVLNDRLRAQLAAGPPDGRLNQKTWTRVDFQEYAYLKNGKLVIAASNVPRSAKTGRSVEPVPFGWPSVSYAYLNSLPTGPARLMAVIKDNLKAEPDPIGAEGTGNVDVFNAVQGLLQNTVLPPRLLAGLYGVLARDPAVHFERSVTDLAGRSGVGFSTVQEGYLEQQIVINPRTCAYMGYIDVAVRAHTSTGLDGTAHFRRGQVLGWEALLGSGIVQRPGQLP